MKEAQATDPIRSELNRNSARPLAEAVAARAATLHCARHRAKVLNSFAHAMGFLPTSSASIFANDTPTPRKTKGSVPPARPASRPQHCSRTTARTSSCQGRRQGRSWPLVSFCSPGRCQQMLLHSGMSHCLPCPSSFAPPRVCGLHLKLLLQIGMPSTSAQTCWLSARRFSTDSGQQGVAAISAYEKKKTLMLQGPFLQKGQASSPRLPSKPNVLQDAGPANHGNQGPPNQGGKPPTSQAADPQATN